MDLSVVIVSYNVRELLKHCLLSVQTASEFTDCEILVVDNDSSDCSAEMVRTEFPEVRLIKNSVNNGFSAANNQAIAASSGKFILLLNPDTLIEPDTFSKGIDFMKQHPEAGAVGVKMIDGSGRFLPESKRAFPSPLTSFFKISGISALFPHSNVINRYYLPQIDNDKSGVIEVVSGAFMLLSRDALYTAGLPDEDFFMYGEDIDLSFRLVKAGFKNYYFPEIQIIHYKGKSTDRKNFDDIRHFYNAMKIYALKRQEENFSLKYFIILPAIRVREFIAILIRFFKIRFT